MGVRLFLICLGLGLFSCRSEYAALTLLPNPTPFSRESMPPAGSDTRKYRCSVDVSGKHLSGILIFKPMAGGHTRALFTGEAGPTFFDFELSDSAFQVHYCMKRLDKKAVLRTLRRDLELLLMLNKGIPAEAVYTDGKAWYYPFDHKKERLYYVTEPGCGQLLRAESGNGRKKKVLVYYRDFEKGMPKAASIEHQTFTFVIRLEALQNE